ncbi:anti sigma factor C-terminal domain-containing protein [Halalkalibacter alkalisediminis]|uniref:Anti sigma factor C-terminal domain-containing protein n=2 Tax=Halalkalibacter alkalisediminis TaxID=935616 RepID=A0ABV6NN06_9BACI
MSKDNKDEELQDFLLDDKDFQNAIKKTRRKSVIKNVSITFVILLVGYILMYSVSSHILANNIHKTDVVESRWLYLTKPNIQQNGVMYSYNMFSSDSVHSYSKRFDERSVPWVTRTGNFTLRNATKEIIQTTEFFSEEENQQVVINNQNGQRELQFYHPSVNYSNLPNGLNVLDELSSNTIAEYAISFDKAYPFHEVQEMLNKNHTEWLWVDVEYEENIQMMQRQEERDFPSTFRSGQVYGYPYNSLTDWSNPEFFINQLRHEEIQSSSYHRDIANDLLEMLKEDNPKLIPEEVHIIGAVLTGTANELREYQSKEFIRASSLGATINKY